MTDNFKVGDKVLSRSNFPMIDQYVKGKELTVIENDDDVTFLVDEQDLTVQVRFANGYPYNFELVKEIEPNSTFGVQVHPGIYRPKLEDRKLGKIGAHMTIDGFPNALMEVSRVMQWAADVKGYKLHDWKNLPDAENGFASAGYRHMLENSIQKAQGVSPVDRVDHESKLLHLAHQAFNILAQIELIKTGKIQ